jgi:hypothetical protein
LANPAIPKHNEVRDVFFCNTLLPNSLVDGSQKVQETARPLFSCFTAASANLEGRPRRIRSPSPDFSKEEGSPKVQKTAKRLFLSPRAAPASSAENQIDPAASFHIRTQTGSFVRRPRAPAEKFSFTPILIGGPFMSRCSYKDRSRIFDPFNRAAIEIQDNFSFKWGDQVIPLTRTHVGGAHCLISRLPADLPRLIPNIRNDSLIMKTFLAQSILSNDDRISVGDGSAAHVLAQYHKLVELDFPVSKLYNRADVDQGCGYFMFEYVPHAYQPSWDPHATIENNQELNIIYNFFHFAAQHSIDIDLRPSNLRRRDDGTLVLVDFLENAPKTGANLYFELENRIKTFCKKDDAIYCQLINAIASLKPSYL